MNNEMNDSAPDQDDHEPGDVNGNVDPAWAKKQKQKAKNDAWKEKRAQRRTERSTQGGDAPVGASTPATNEGLPAADAAAPMSNADAQPQGATEGTEGQPRHSGERRARGMRRSRHGGQRRDRTSNSSNSLRPIASGEEGELISIQDSGENNLSPDLMGRSSTEFDAESVSPDNPNPGAFGDPNRPMDRGAKRSRNRNRNREKSDRGRAIRAARENAQNADSSVEGIAIEGAEGVEGARDGERLHKVLAQQGLGSRRAMEAMIESGDVEVNGEPAKVGQVVNESDRVYVKRRKVAIKLGDDKPRIMIYHKPSGEIVTRDDPEERDTVFDRLPRPDHGKWIAIGRLDFNTEGLLLFTTSGELANRMMHPRYEIVREYSVRVLGELTHEQEDQLIDGIELDDGPARVLSLDRIDRDSDGANHWYRITLNEGRNREVRRMFEHLGLTVSRLIRTRYGAVNMPSWLKRGQYKLLDENDTFNVLEAVGMRSRKKLEKAARFGGARGKLPQGPVGPMRSATEHESIWNGAPALSGARGERRNARTMGRGPRGRNDARGDGAGASLSLQQQQFPGFGGATDNGTAPGRRGRSGGLGGNKMRRGRGGEVNGNVDPNFRAGRNERNNRRGRGPRPNAMPDFDENGNQIVAAPQLGEDGQPIANPRNERGSHRNTGNNNRGRNRRGRGRNAPNGATGDSVNENSASGANFADNNGANSTGEFTSGENAGSNAGDNARPRGRNRRGARRGNGGGRGRRNAAEGGTGESAPTAPDSEQG
jgi:23S rRNA pseudouridine2605 synthase